MTEHEPRRGVRPLIGSVILATIAGAGALLHANVEQAPVHEPTVVGPSSGVRTGTGASVTPVPPPPSKTLKRSATVTPRPTSTPRPTKAKNVDLNGAYKRCVANNGRAFCDKMYGKILDEAVREVLKPKPKPSKTKVNKGYCDIDSPGDCADTDTLKSYDAYREGDIK